MLLLHLVALGDPGQQLNQLRAAWVRNGHGTGDGNGDAAWARAGGRREALGLLPLHLPSLLASQMSPGASTGPSSFDSPSSWKIPLHGRIIQIQTENNFHIILSCFGIPAGPESPGKVASDL